MSLFFKRQKNIKLHGIEMRFFFIKNPSKLTIPNTSVYNKRVEVIDFCSADHAACCDPADVGSRGYTGK